MFIIGIIIFEFLDQVYPKKIFLDKSIGFILLGLAWIELHVINPSNRSSPQSTEDLSDELTVESLIDLINITELKLSTSTNGDS